MTPEQIADEAAKKSISDPDERGRVLFLGVPLHAANVLRSDADWQLRDPLRQALAEVVLDAIQRDRMASPVPGGLSEEQLAKICKSFAGASGSSSTDEGAVLDLLAHVEHLTRALREIVASGPEGEAWGRGFDAGVRAASLPALTPEQAAKAFAEALAALPRADLRLAALALVGEAFCLRCGEARQPDGAPCHCVRDE